MIKYLIYYLLPKKVVYKLIKDANSYSIFSLTNDYDMTTVIEYNDYISFSKDDKLRCIQKYINISNKLKWIETNKWNIISVFGLLRQ